MIGKAQRDRGNREAWLHGAAGGKYAASRHEQIRGAVNLAIPVYDALVGIVGHAAGSQMMGAEGIRRQRVLNYVLCAACPSSCCMMSRACCWVRRSMSLNARCMCGTGSPKNPQR